MQVGNNYVGIPAHLVLIICHYAVKTSGATWDEIAERL